MDDHDAPVTTQLNLEGAENPKGEKDPAQGNEQRSRDA
jgi:hypothetical protein